MHCSLTARFRDAFNEDFNFYQQAIIGLLDIWGPTNSNRLQVPHARIQPDGRIVQVLRFHFEQVAIQGKEESFRAT